jgi:hypothetical protein
MEKVIYGVTIVLFCLGVVVVYWAIRAHRRALAEQRKIRWVFDQANRALDMIKNDKPSTILAGLQLLSAYDIPPVRMKAFPRLMELTQHSDKQVAELAEHVIELSQEEASAGRQSAANR